MAELHQFTYGWVIPVFGYALSLLGALVAIGCTARVRRSTRWHRRLGGLVLAGWALGGLALWSMHFVALIGFTVTGAAVNYDPVTAGWGLAVAIGASFAALCAVGFGRAGRGRILLGGLLTGGALAGAHYADARAMRLGGTVALNRPLVAVSVAVPVVLCAIALWWAFGIGGRLGRVIGAAIVAVAAGCAHYLGMAALRIDLPASGTAPDLPGLSVNLYLAPVVLFAATVAIALAYLVVAAPGRERERVPADHASGPVARLAPEG